MQAEFYAGDELIGLSRLTASDPPMGGASGSFEPTETYRRDLHANTIDGDYVGDRGVVMRITSLGFNPIDAHVAIHDWQETLQEREVHVLIEASRYEELFSSDPAYRSYFRLDLPEEERLTQDRTIEARFRARAIRDWLWLLGILGGLALLLVWIF